MLIISWFPQCGDADPDPAAAAEEIPRPSKTWDSWEPRRPAAKGIRQGAEVDAGCAYLHVGGTGWAQPGTADNRISAV